MTVSTAGVPHGLGLAIDFVNTRDIEESIDALDSPRALTQWLSERSLLSVPGDDADGDDLAAAIALREALRSVLLAHNENTPPGADALGIIDRTAEDGRLSVRFTPGAERALVLAPRQPGIAGALAAILAGPAAAAADGSWLRVKACAADDCHWAFYDGSRNRSGRWCDMAVCGNRMKVRSYRRRLGAP